MLIDLHQHVWTAPLLDRLQSRRTWPFVERERGLTVLHSAGERPHVIDTHAEAPERRAAMLDADGVDLALVAISSPIGIEALPRQEARDLIDAHLEGVGALGPRFAAWGPVALDDPDPDDVDRLLVLGSVGISMPAGALVGPNRLAAVAPLLERLATYGRPLFVHPGPAPGDVRTPVVLGDPLWWPALTDYVAQMQASWLSFMAIGRREHPNLTVVFAMLAGGAPLQAERLAARGGPHVDLRDPGVFYETSSYGSAAVEAIAALTGERQLVYGTDRPVIQPLSTGRDPQLARNAAVLILNTPALARPAVAA